MTDYTKLVEALRCCAENFGCPIECPRYSPADEGVRACVSRLEKDAAAAIEELQAQLPKRGEMYFLEYDNPETGEYEQTYFQCSVCGKYFYALDECEVKHFNYCPNCGAKMEVQDA